MKLGVKILGTENADCIANAKAVVVGKTYELVTDEYGVVCFVDEDGDFNYGVATGSAYDHAVVIMADAKHVQTLEKN